MNRNRIVCCFGALGVISLLFASGAPTAAAEFYIDPERGSPEGDGSKARPWQTLQGVVDRGLIRTRAAAQHPHEAGGKLKVKHPEAPIGPGDTIYLRSGDHGRLMLRGAYNKKPITIAAAPGATPRLSRVRLRAASGWRLRGLHVSSSFAEADKTYPLIAIDSHNWHGPSHHVTVEDCTVFSTRDASDWGKQQWNQRACNGISVSGDHVTLKGNLVKNTNFGISVSGAAARVVENVVDGFAGDGMRGNGDGGVFAYNTIKNAYDVNKNHDDGFQSWSTGPEGPGSGTVKNVVLRGNLIINHENPDHPLRTTLQGIGCFDGTYAGWVIENNVVITDHWHGITLLGLRDCRIVNNTVVDLSPGKPEPWIMAGKHKTGTPPRNVLVRNNLARSFKIAEGTNVTADHNLVVNEPARFYVDADAFDVHLKRGAPAVDAGAAAQAPARDREGDRRPHGEGVDVGADEWTP